MVALSHCQALKVGTQRWWRSQGKGDRPPKGLGSTKGYHRGIHCARGCSVTVCLNPVAWKIRAAEGYRTSKPINNKVTGLLYIDDLKIFAASESKLERVKSSMEDVGLKWNPKNCVVAHVKRGYK